MIDDMIAAGEAVGAKARRKGVYIEINYNFDYN